MVHRYSPFWDLATSKEKRKKKKRSGATSEIPSGPLQK
jgi:hypothetical protein